MEIIRTFAPLEPAKPLNDAQMCGSFYFYTMSNRVPFQKSYTNAHDLVRLLQSRHCGSSQILNSLFLFVSSKSSCPSTRSILYFPPCKVVFGCKCCILVINLLFLLVAPEFYRQEVNSLMLFHLKSRNGLFVPPVPSLRRQLFSHPFELQQHSV